MVLSFSPATHIFRCITNKQKCIPKSRSKEETPINKRAAMHEEVPKLSKKLERAEREVVSLNKKKEKKRTSVVERRQYCEEKKIMMRVET